MKRAILAGLSLAVLTTSAARAETRMFSYDPISPDAKRLTGAGVTILFNQGLLGGARPIKVLATGVSQLSREDTRHNRKMRTMSIVVVGKKMSCAEKHFQRLHSNQGPIVHRNTRRYRPTLSVFLPRM